MKKEIVVNTVNRQYFPTAELATDYFVFSHHTLLPNHGRIHYHTGYEFEVLTEGKVEMEINSSKHICSAGEYWIVYPNNYHKCASLSEKSSIISIKFNEKALLSDVLYELQKNIYYFIGKLSDEEYEFFSNEIDSMFIKITNVKKDITKKTIIRSALSQIIAKILDTAELESTNSYDSKKFPKALYKSISYIRENFTQKLYRDEVASKFGFSSSYYSAIFKQYTGKSFSDFLIGEKLDYAYYLLLATEIPIGNVAEMSGFESFAYFSKIFKNAYGQTPRQLRKSTDTNLNS